MASGANAYIRTQSYDDKRQLDPERIIIPPPTIDYGDGTPSFNVANLQKFDHLNGSCGNPSFMRSIRSLHQLRLRHVMLEWKYEQRTSAQPILPFLFLGPGSAAQNSAFVQSSGITMMVAVRSGVSARQLPRFLNPSFFRSASGLESITVDLDSPYDLMQHLRHVIKSMNDHLEKSCARNPICDIDDIKAKILVFCESGNERSTVLVCAYLMVVYGVDAVAAIQVAQSQRFSIDVKDDMKSMLLDFEEILVAERQVAAEAYAQEQFRSSMDQPAPEPPTLNKSFKRSIDKAYESDEEMEDTTEWSGAMWSNRRVGSAPFADAGT